MIENYTIKYNTTFFPMSYDTDKNEYIFDKADLLHVLDCDKSIPIYASLEDRITDKEIYNFIKSYNSPKMCEFFKWFITEILYNKIHLIYNIIVYIEALQVKVAILPRDEQIPNSMTAYRLLLYKNIAYTDIPKQLEQIPKITEKFQQDLESSMKEALHGIYKY